MDALVLALVLIIVCLGGLTAALALRLRECPQPVHQPGDRVRIAGGTFVLTRIERSLDGPTTAEFTDLSAFLRDGQLDTEWPT